MNHIQLSFLLAVLLPLGSSAQIELLIFEYSQYMQQTGPDSLVPYGDYSDFNDAGNFGVYFEIEGEETIANASISGPPGQEALPFDQEDGSYELEYKFETAAEMTAAVPAGTYTFTGTGSVSGAFSESVTVPAYSPLTHLRITNFAELQSFDPTQPLTIEWEEFTEGQGSGPNLGYAGVVGAEIFGFNGFSSYIAWDSDSIAPEGAFGLLPTVTSVTIPAGTLNASDFYIANVFFARVDSAADTSSIDGALVAAVTGYELEINIYQEGNNPNPTWAGYPVDANGYVQTAPWLGSLYVTHAPWAWSPMVNKWLYIPENGVSPEGGWAWVPR